MIWFGLFELLGLIGALILIYAYCRIRNLGFWSFIWKNLRWVMLGIVVVWVIIALVCAKPLYSTAQCYFRGVSMHADTKYSWYLGECQIKTKSGSYVPLGRSRGLPEGPDGEQDESDAYSY